MDSQKLAQKSTATLMDEMNRSLPQSPPSFHIAARYHEDCLSLYNALKSSNCIDVEPLIRMIAEFGASAIEQCSDCSKQLIFPNEDESHADVRQESFGIMIVVCSNCVAKETNMIIANCWPSI